MEVLKFEIVATFALLLGQFSLVVRDQLARSRDLGSVPAKLK
ncbi:MAG: hypothetical protein ACRETG_09375 [Steroidobacteraceae bacterium]